MTTTAALPPETQAALDEAAGALKKTLGANLRSLVLYGSAVRGNLVPKVSDLNLLILLEESTGEAHAAIADAIRGPVRIEPFILGRAPLARSIQSFAVKFFSIRRNYRVLHGADPFADLTIDEALARFLCEQAVRNLHLRCVRAFVVIGHDRPRYSTFLARTSSAFFTDLAEGLRRIGTDVPRAYEERVPLFEKTFGVDASILLRILELKSSARVLSAGEVKEFHSRLFRLLDGAVRWMEAQWPPLR
jgi:predicted nucleotidyltransferase